MSLRSSVPRLLCRISFTTALKTRPPTQNHISISKRSFTAMSSINEQVQTTFSQNLGGTAHENAPAHQAFSLEDVPDQSGKVAVVTGGSEGIGYGVTSTLLARNISKLFILSVDKEVVDKAKNAVSQELGQDKAERTVWLQCDLSDWSRIKKVAEQIQAGTDRLDILVNNAARGIMTAQHTEYGVDRHMAVNHFGHALLTSYLLPLLKSTADKGSKARIVNVSSNAHQSAPKDLKFDSLDEINKDYGPMGQYGMAKLAKLLHARYLSRHTTPSHPNLLANAIHPGVVKTKMSQEDIHEPYPLAGYLMSAVLAPFKKDQFEGAASSLYAATVTETSGEYVCPPAAPEPGSELAQSVQLGENLMRLTREAIKEKTGEEITDH